jgi:hypothetical protein
MLAQVDIGSTCKSSFTDSRGEDGRRTGVLYVVGGCRLPSIYGDGWDGDGWPRGDSKRCRGRFVGVGGSLQSLGQIMMVLEMPGVGGGPRKVTQPLPRSTG